MGGPAQRRWGTVAMLGLALGLAGCAAGAPAAVVPDPSAEQAAAPVVAAPELTPLAEVAAPVSDAPPADAATDAAAAAAIEPTGDAAPEPAIAVAPATESGAAPAAGGAEVPAAQPANAEPAAAIDTSAAADAVEPDTAAQTAPATTDSVTTDPATTGSAPAAPAQDAAASDPAGSTTPSFAAAPAAANVGAADAPAPAAEAVAPEVVEAPAAAQATGRPPAPPPDGSGASQLIEGHADGRKEVALTFDAGSDRGYTDQILDFLRDNGIKGTFGMTGYFAEQHPDLILRMVNEGHQLINHSWSHGSMTGANTGEPPWTYEQLADELASTEQVVRDITGGYELKPYFRPPFGDYDATSLGYLYDLGYPLTIMWTCDTQAWRGWDAAKILEYCTSVPMEDDIILMHVGASAAGDFEVLPSMVAWYLERGYTFVTVEEMLQP